VSEEAPNGKRARLLGNLRLIQGVSELPIYRQRADAKDHLIQAMSKALLAVAMRHQLTVQKFGGMIICEGCGELVGPDGELCEDLQVVWDALYPKRE
jgi:hypothetical protein